MTNKMNKLGKACMNLQYAQKLLSKSDRNRIGQRIEDLKQEIAVYIAEEADLKTLSDVRRNVQPGRGDLFSDVSIKGPSVTKALLYRFLEQSPQSKRDDSCILHDILDSVGTKAALEAPVETPAEFAAWLRRPNRKKKAASA